MVKSTVEISKNFVAFLECRGFSNYSIFFRAGSVDALIVLATQSVKNDFLYQEAFIATYRTFVSTHDLLEKLVQRFRKFNNRKDEQQMIYKRVAHCAFSLMVSSIKGGFFPESAICFLDLQISKKKYSKKLELEI